MQQEKIKTIICWTVTAVLMITIFWLSAQSADSSNSQSGAVIEFLQKIFGKNVFTSFIVRKAAHFTEYVALGFMLNISMLQTRKTSMPYFSTFITSIYAITDEVHQIFVEGRSCQLTDWAIDTAGAILGSCIFLLMLYIVKRIIQKKENSIDRQNN